MAPVAAIDGGGKVRLGCPVDGGALVRLFRERR